MQVDIKLNIGAFVLTCVIAGLGYALTSQTKKVISLKREIEQLQKMTENS